MLSRALFLSSLAGMLGCALDPAGVGPSDGGGDSTSTTEAGPGSTSGSTSTQTTTTTTTATTTTTTTGDPGSTGTGGSPGTGAGGPGSGGEGGSTGEGAGTSQGGAGSGGDGTGGSGGAADGGGGGGVGGFCGDGTVEAALGEQCEPANSPGECSGQCQWLGGCGGAIDVAFTPGGTTVQGDTTQAPSALDFGGSCSTTNPATAVHLLRYTPAYTGSYVGVAVATDGTPDIILSMHPACAVDAEGTCLDDGAVGTTAACCTDAFSSGIEELVSTATTAGVDLFAAINGFQGASGAYTAQFREYRFLLDADFEGNGDGFTPSGSANTWSAVTGAWCPSGVGSCWGVGNDAQVHTKEVLTSPVVDASNTGYVEIRWAHRLNENGGNPNDRHRIEVSIAGGDWTEVYNHSASDETARRAVDISSLAANQANVRFRFLFEDGGASFYWYVDDVSVLAY